MRIDLTSLMFNMDVQSGGGTPSWGTSLGQSSKEEHRFTYLGCEKILIGMLYKHVEIKDAYCPLGKGGNKQDDYEYVLAGVFDKIYVNDVYIPKAKFELLLVKQLAGQAQQHIGRRTLKYSPKMTYKKETINDDCFAKIRKQLGLSDKAAWFVSDINILNQDELHFVAKIVDAKKPKTFKDSEDRKNYCNERADVTEKQDIFIEEIEYEDGPIIINSKNNIEIKI